MLLQLDLQLQHPLSSLHSELLCCPNFLLSIFHLCDNLPMLCSLQCSRGSPKILGVFFQKQTGPLALHHTWLSINAEYEFIWVIPIKTPAPPWAVLLQGGQTPAFIWAWENCMGARPTSQAVFPLKSTTALALQSISLKQRVNSSRKKITHGKHSRNYIGK